MQISTEPLSEPTPITLQAGPTAVVRHTGVTSADLRPLFDQGFMAIADSGAAIGGPAFAHYRGDPSAVFDIELGFPVSAPLAKPVAGDVTVEPSELPSGEALAISHLGGYDALGETWRTLAAAAQQKGLQPTSWFEVYITEPGPDVDPATLRTDLFLLL